MAKGEDVNISRYGITGLTFVPMTNLTHLLSAGLAMSTFAVILTYVLGSQ